MPVDHIPAFTVRDENGRERTMTPQRDFCLHTSFPGGREGIVACTIGATLVQVDYFPRGDTVFSCAPEDVARIKAALTALAAARRSNDYMISAANTRPWDSYGDGMARGGEDD